MKLRDINSMTNTELDQLAESNDRKSKLKFRYHLLQDMSRDPPAKDWLVKGIVVLGETSAWIAPPGGMKSALLGELAFAVASNVDWHGHRTKRTGAVVYFALERADLVNRRLQAYLARSSEESDPPPIAVIAGMVDLMKTTTVPDIVASIRAVEAETGFQVVLIVFDTFAKLIAAGGGDENKASDQGAVFANIQRIKDAIGCHVALIGHTGKDEKRGSRGSNAIDGDVDVMVSISGDEIKTATVIKANDAPDGPLFSFVSEVHDFGRDEDGDPITVNIVSTEEVSRHVVVKPDQVRLTENQEAMLRVLRDAGPSGLSTADWNAKARDIGIGITRKATLHNLKAQLKDRDLVREYNDVWHVQR